MKKLFAALLLLSLLAAGPVDAKARKIDDHHWAGVERIIAIGDLHGDYDRYVSVMRSAGLIDEKGKWSGGKTHFVQTGDIPDRGPDTLEIIEHMLQLAKQARRKGGYVHMLIGNHEAMNVIGDLRYVSDGEFEAFVGPNSSRLQNLQWERQVEWMRGNMLNFEEIDLIAYRAEWEQKVPLGWVEHRQAWSVNGKYGSLVRDHQVAVKINDTIFLHGGISPDYCKFSLESLTDQVIGTLENFDPTVESIVTDPMGPLWYRGLVREDETEEFGDKLDQILERYDAKRIVVGHTPTGGVIWPRFDGRVLANDTGIATYYGAHKGVLELTGEGATGIYGDKRIPIPVKNEDRIDYLKAVIEADDNSEELMERLQRMQEAEANPAGGAVTDDAGMTDPESAAMSEPIPGICR